MSTVKEALEIISKLTPAEMDSIRTMLLSPVFIKSVSTEEYLTEKRFANGRVCPLCGQSHVIRNGHRKDGVQRYKCMKCGKTFVITSNSILFGTKKTLSVWKSYVSCMMKGLSVRESAKICGINRNTAFAWRHKILDALQDKADKVILDGIIEADETFFPVSYKGNHSHSRDFNMPRKPHKRGNSVHTRGISEEQVCVACAVNRSGQSIAKPTNTGRISAQDLHELFDNRIAENSIFVTDKMNAYAKFTKENKNTHIQIKDGKTKNGIYHIQHVNNYHGRLKKFMSKFNGVSTKYMENYLIWNDMINNTRETDSEKEKNLLAFAVTNRKTVKCRSLHCRTPFKNPQHCEKVIIPNFLL